MHTLKTQKRSLAQGVVSCNVSLIAAPFTSDSVDFFDSTATHYGVTAFDRKAGERMFFISLKKTIVPGTYEFKPESDVYGYYYHEHESFGWIYYPEKGEFLLKSVDFEKLEIDATFAFTSTRTPDQQPVTFENGVFTLTGPGA
ncbi:hypothetical protein [Pseudomonas sp. R2-60-08W]|uniref:hypothetical protein n=1 Tax=Pseudomonas sp. R2-60-08W TaxID=1173280 RepID=UPI000F56DAFB|nr:hypothetical protein [Pseudomonas sp. R2-60-08W]AZF28235.1 hypothetical protein C4J90_4089 [Pseudomonas sp. R2-60-08W]